MNVALDGSLLGARFSGVERSVAQLIRHLPTAAGPNDHFTVFVGQAFDTYVERFHPDGFVDDPRIELVQTGVDNRQRSSRIWWQQAVLPRLVHARRADVFHGPAYLVPALMPIASVVTLYDLFAIDQPRFCTTSNRLHYRLALPAGLRRSKVVVVPSSDTRRAVARWFPHAYERTVTIPLGVERRFAEPAAGGVDLQNLYDLPKQYMLWVGNVEPKKNVGILLQALHRLQRRGRPVPHLLILGALSWGANELLEQYLNLGLQRSVTFLGRRVTDAHLPALYAGASAFLFPSLAEGFGLPPLEAMAAGTPVAVSQAGALPEVVGDAALVLPPTDVDAWADAIERLETDEALRGDLIARGRARAAEFTWARTAAATVEVYRRAAALGEDEYDPATGEYLPAAD